MRMYNEVVTFMLTAVSISALGQCKKPEMKPVWDAGSSQFKCINMAVDKGLAGGESVSPTGSKDFCKTVRDRLLNVCPPSEEGKTCRSKAKSTFNTCYKGGNADRSNDEMSSGSGNQMSNAHSESCMTAFDEQQKVCQSRRMPPASPGKAPVPDTCLQDALTARTKCLAEQSLTPANQTNTSNAESCMATFNQQQKACQSRRMPPPPPGKAPVPDTCLQDALTAQTRCLAKVH
jgi:hypothetical protein